jgi:chromosome segregation ATPase
MSGAQEAFEIARDSNKMKAKLKELADAEESLQASHEKVKAKNKELFAEYDAKKAEMDVMVKAAQDKVREAQSAANGAMRPVEDERAKLVKDQKAFERRVAKLEQDRNTVKNQRDQLAKEQEAFAARVAEFGHAVTVIQGLCEKS